ncbi:MAG: hypothetical protein F6K30_27660 [Cyanothece sp. SIO2G6]|nr:hypothetical protein [Cyanothece sp. SIO2G6]
MHLSPITSYHLQRLFRQHCDRLQPLINSHVLPNDYSAEANVEATLEAAWQALSQRQSEMNSVIQKLESLVSMHQALEKQGTMYSRDLASVERTIFNVLGFQIADISCNV